MTGIQFTISGSVTGNIQDFIAESSEEKVFARCCCKVGPASETMYQRYSSIGCTSRIGLVSRISTAPYSLPLPCEAKSQYLLTLQVSRYCFLALQGIFRAILTRNSQGGTKYLFFYIILLSESVLYYRRRQ